MDDLRYPKFTAWMVRRDGSIFPVVQHIYGNPEDVEETLYAAEWLYGHTNRSRTRRGIESFTRMWLLRFAKEKNGAELREQLYRMIKERPYQFITPRFADKIADWKEQNVHPEETGIMGIDEYCRQVAMDLNEEFMRVRLGGMYHTEPGNRKLYFRISSEDYNWSRVIREFSERPPLDRYEFYVVVDEESAKVNPAILKQQRYFLASDSADD